MCYAAYGVDYSPIQERKHFRHGLTSFGTRYFAYAFVMVIFFIFSYLEFFFVVFYLSFHFYLWGPRFLQPCADSGEDVMEGV